MADIQSEEQVLTIFSKLEKMNNSKAFPFSFLPILFWRQELCVDSFKRSCYCLV